MSFVPLVSPATIKKYQKKAARLESFIKSENRAKHPEVSQRVALLRSFYAAVEKKATVRRTRETLAAFKQEEETIGQHEDALIRYVIVLGENKAKVESSKNL